MFVNHPHSEGPLGKFRSPLRTQVFFEGENDPPNDPPKNDPPKNDPPSGDTVPKAQVDSIVQQRVEESKRKAEKDIVDALGVSLEEAKQIIADRKAADDAEKSEAQLAREAADREKAEAETAKSTSAQALHQANVARVLLTMLPAGMGDKDVDDKISLLSKLVDAAPGATLDDIRTAAKTLKDKEPALFGGSTQRRLPPSDPKGNPPRQPRGDEDGFVKGQERAKAATTSASRSAFKVE